MSIRSRGVTLVELIVFIVIVGVAMAGVFAAFNTITAASADPQVRKQVLAIAESLMDEVALMPFTFCDPNDANDAAATNSGVAVAGGCATLSEDTTIGPESGESRYGPSFFDNVSDYGTFAMNAGTGGIRDITNNTVTGLSGYTASITVIQAGLASGVDAISAADALRISVTVTGPSGVTTTLEGYRTRYAPNTVP
jgi:MSHA pilin protein MshD